MGEHQRWVETEASNLERVKNLAIIPARSGSKGLKHKNIKKLNGKHLMGYAIEAALASNIYDCVHISTDSKEYAEIAKQYGGDVSFLRTEDLSTDKADTWDVVRYVVNRFQELGKSFQRVTLLQPTSPLCTAEDIRNASVLFEEKCAQSVISVCEAEHCPKIINTLGKDFSMEGFIDLNQNVQRQGEQKHYRLNGAIYMFHISVLEHIQELYGKKSYAYIMPRERSVDIDTIFDFKYAEFLLPKEK